ncbi:MAG: glycosyltransferase [Bacteroidota bacterium]
MHKKIDLGSKVLFISSWYPTYIKPTNGNFIFKHAECAAINNNIRFIHVCIDHDLKENAKTDISSDPFYSEVVYLKASDIFLLKGFINYLKIIFTYFSLFKKLHSNGFKPDLVHANVVFPIGIVAFLYKLLYRIPYIISEHWTGYHSYAKEKPSKFQLLIMRMIAKKSSCLLPVSEDLKNAMIKNGLKSNYTIIPNVVNTKKFTVQLNENNSSLIRIVHISTLNENQKNFRLLLQSFYNAKQKQQNIELHIVSEGGFEQYQDFIKELKLDQSIVFHGVLKTDEVAEVLKAGSFFVLSSNYENLPCVLIESLACGVPVVSTNVGGISEIINENNGILVSPNNEVEFSNALLKMIENYKTYNKEQIKKDADERYSYSAVARALDVIYQKYEKKC